ncbi:phospholipase D/nuclease [Hypoxylon trugodes]|uniref:phospholipase D/nuclease n=1 Tax=Hypoxylon trugodes TaxID=326681 RepID=UPI00218EDCE1|nr:phospholipase D/nuclease [Hypoxylon trugodes]KAI1390584.1 phospholipase D/nuclease [Hypoxylon trugodes]
MDSTSTDEYRPCYITYDSFPEFKQSWKRSLADSAPTLRDEFPDYHLSDPESLVHTRTQACTFDIGTGSSIYTQSIIPAIVRAKHEVILVTCFWAKSPTLTALKETLERLAEWRRQRIQEIRASNPNANISSLRIRICFSSRSFFQKLFHTSSRDGYVYPQSTWSRQLGLPNPEILEAGLIDLRIKSLFFLPFSVMHPKFLIVDRERAWLPSCNVSWETWLEFCVEITGDAVDGLVEFYRHVWDKKLENIPQPGSDDASRKLPSPRLGDLQLTSTLSTVGIFEGLLPDVSIPTVLLPSSHHRNPKFDIIPWHNSPSPPSTPLNVAILLLLDIAKHFIYIQTPNLTSTAVIDKLLEALERGVNVAIVTSKRLMILEQLVTAGTTTSICVRSLIQRYDRLRTQYQQSKGTGNQATPDQSIDIEAQRPPLGRLRISYFRPDPDHEDKKASEEPVQSHMKFTLVDGQYVVLGSGNMDRASWFTSQELGIMFHSGKVAGALASAVGIALSHRKEHVFSSTAEDDEESERQPSSQESTTNQDYQHSKKTASYVQGERSGMSRSRSDFSAFVTSRMTFERFMSGKPANPQDGRS